MKKALIVLILVAAVAAVWYVFIYEKTGPVEEIGREVDAAVEKIRYGEETPMEKASRKTGEAIEELKKE